MKDHFNALACPTCGTEHNDDMRLFAQSADAIARALLAVIGDNPNYTETVLDIGGTDSITVDFPGVSLVVTAIREGGKSPHQLRVEAEIERDQARAELASLRALLDPSTTALAARE